MANFKCYSATFFIFRHHVKQYYMSKPIKTAITSFGMSGQVFHGPSLKVNPRFEVSKILERTKSLSVSLFPEAQIVKSYEQLLGDSEIELVVVNTPDIFHFEMAKQAIEAGKNIVVEKPVTLRSSEAEELVKMAKKRNVLFTVYQNRRWDGDFLTVRKVLEGNKLGRLVEFESHFDRHRTAVDPVSWKEKGDEYAGMLYKLGSHMVDQAYVLFGNPKAITAHLKIVRTNGEITDYYDIRLEYDDFAALLKCSYLVKNPGPRYSLHGENGTFHKYGIDPQEELLKTGHLPDGEKLGKESPDDWGTLYYEEGDEEIEELVETVPGNYNIFYDNVASAIRDGEQLLVQPEESVEVLRILEACLQSSREKRTIIWEA